MVSTIFGYFWIQFCFTLAILEFVAVFWVFHYFCLAKKNAVLAKNKTSLGCAPKFQLFTEIEPKKNPFNNTVSLWINTPENGPERIKNIWREKHLIYLTLTPEKLTLRQFCTLNQPLPTQPSQRKKSRPESMPHQGLPAAKLRRVRRFFVEVAGGLWWSGRPAGDGGGANGSHWGLDEKFARWWFQIVFNFHP